jgi:hypothetical protein
MKRISLISKLIIVCFLIAGTNGLASDRKLPLIDGKETVATVNDEPITLQEFNAAIASSHMARSGKKKAGRIDYAAILERLINTRLLLLEARNMGFDELPGIIKTVENYSKETLMELLLENYVKDIKADDAEVERLYKETVREWQLKSVKFKKEADAKNIEAQIKAGNNFDAIVQKAVADGIAQGGEEEYLKNKDLTASVAQLVSKMEIGSISPIVSVGKQGFILFKLEGLRYPEKENPKVRKNAHQQALTQKKIQAARDYYSDLKHKYVKYDEKLFEALDYESKEPGFENLLKDERVLAEITGEKPVTVAALSKALKIKFYHGIDRAIEGKKVNKKKKEKLEDIVQKRVLLKEALVQGIDRTEAYINRVKEYENSVIFGAFIKKVVAPEIKLDVEELKTYYNANTQQYTSPQMMRIKSLVFEKRNDAAKALDKLMQGTDFNWLSSHADGRVDNNAKGLLKFESKVLILTSLPEGVQQAVTGAKPGDFKLYESPEGHFYVLYIYHVVAPKPKSFDDVKAEITEVVYKDKLRKAVEVWAGKLKEYYPVKIYRKDLKK